MAKHLADGIDGTAYNWMATPSLHFTQGECRMSLTYYTMNSDNTMRMNIVIYWVNSKDGNPNNVRAISSEEDRPYLRWDSEEAFDLSGRRVADGYSGIRIMNGRKYIKNENNASATACIPTAFLQTMKSMELYKALKSTEFLKAQVVGNFQEQSKNRLWQ